MWLALLIILTYLFTVAGTAKYKEQAIEYREEMIKNKQEFDLELLELLKENSQLKHTLEELGYGHVTSINTKNIR